MEDFETILDDAKWEILKEEGITKEDLELVDLDIEFSPVIPYKGASPCEVTETMGEKYIVHGVINGSQTVGVEMLTIMRYRFLINRPRINLNIF
jgi:hypothetical protein